MQKILLDSAKLAFGVAVGVTILVGGAAGALAGAVAAFSSYGPIVGIPVIAIILGVTVGALHALASAVFD